MPPIGSRLPLVLGVTLLLADVSAQQPEPVWSESPPDWVAAERADAFAAFTQQHGAHRARWSRASGTATEVFGKGVPVNPKAFRDSEHAQEVALELLEEHAGVFGHEGDTWVPRISRRVGPLNILVFDQNRDGLPVIGGRADVRIHVRGRVSMLGARSFEVEHPGKPWPTITPAEAVVAACAELEVKTLNPEALALQPPPHQLVYWAEPHAETRQVARLCWEVTIDAIDEQIVGRAYVDARSGRLRGYASDLSYCSSGHTHVRGFHPGLGRRLDLAALSTASTGAVTAAATSSAAASYYITGTVRVVKPKLDQPGDLSSAAARTASLELVPLPGVRVTVPSTGAFGLTDSTGTFSILHPNNNPVGIEVKLFNAERFRAILPQRGSILTKAQTMTPGVAANVDLSLISTISEDDLAQGTTAFYFDSVHRYLEGILGTLPARTRDLIGATSTPQVCNASYSVHSNATNFFASPVSLGVGVNSTTRPCNTTTYTAYSNVIQHEYGHMIDEVFGGQSLFEGLSEGWGDVIAMYHTGNPLVAEKFFNTGALPLHEWARSGDNTQQWSLWGTMGTGCDYPSPGSITQSVHCQGETWMGFAWKVRFNFRGSVGSGLPNAFNTINDATIHAEDIVIGSIVSNAGDQNGAVLQVYLLDDDDGDLTNGSPHDLWMNMAASAHGLTLPTSNNGVAGFLAFGPGCAGTTDVEIDVMTSPRIGQQLVLVGRNAPAFAPAIAMIGSSSSFFHGVPLPLDLSPVGAPGCRLLTSVAFIVPGQTDQHGVSLAGTWIPYDPSMVGTEFFSQWLVADPTANQVGFVVSQGGRGVVAQ